MAWDARSLGAWGKELESATAVINLAGRSVDCRYNTLLGPVNLCSPNPIPNKEFMSSLREVCRMPLGLPAARWMLEAGAVILRTETELILKSRRVIPAKLQAAGFAFRYPVAKQAMEALVLPCVATASHATKL